METKHTPGPWNANLAPQGGFYIEKDPNELGRYMVLATRNAHEARAEEMHANACLIAAAPEMFEALRQIIWKLERKEVSGSKFDGGVCCTFAKIDRNDAVVDMAREAIAKAMRHNE